MGQVILEGMEFHAYHGCYEEENQIGGKYTVNVVLETNFEACADADDLTSTINYETVYRLVKKEMKIPSKLIEHLGYRILQKITFLFDELEYVKVNIIKHNPPIGAKIANVQISVDKNYKVNCGKCGQTFLSHKEGDCFEKHGRIYPETQYSLTKEFGKNICRKCLEPHLIAR